MNSQAQMNQQENKAEILIFSHIPKTAGTSLRNILSNNYKNSEIFNCYGDNPERKSTKQLVEELSQLLAQEKQPQIKVIAGHMGYGVHQLIPPYPVKHMTVLREPTERVISYYSHVKRHFKNGLGDVARRVSIKEFIESRLSIEVDNWQTRYLSGRGWQKYTLGIGENIAYGECSQEMLEQAKSNLSKYYTFGIQEKFPESLELFGKTFAWQVENIVVNKSTEKIQAKELDEGTKSCIQAHNQMDIQLYQYALELFEKQPGFQLQQKQKIRDVIRLLPPETELLIGFSLASPKPGEAIINKQLEVRGWVMGKNCPASTIELVIGGKAIATTPVNIPRPDVAQIYPGGYHSGFCTQVEINESEEEVIIQVVLENNMRLPLIKAIVSH